MTGIRLASHHVTIGGFRQGVVDLG